MRILFENYRNFNSPLADEKLVRLVNATVETQTPKKEVIENAPDVKYPPDKRTPRNAWSEVDVKYGKTAYRDAISKTVGKLMESGGEHASALTEDSVKRYMIYYHKIFNRFLNDTDKLDKAQKQAEKKLNKHVENELNDLKNAMEKVQSLAGFKKKMPIPENESAVKQHFNEHMNALNNRYFIKSVDQSKTGYMTQAREFQRKMKRRVEARLNWMFNKDGTTSEDLLVYEQELTDQYEFFAGMDGNNAIISNKDLYLLKELSNPTPKDLERFMNEPEDVLIKRLEIMRLMDERAWHNKTKKIGNIIINQAIADGSKEAFKKQISDQIKKADSFGLARKIFMDELYNVSEAGVKETAEFVNKFGEGVFGDVIRYRKNIKPKALDFQTNKQLDYLTSGELTPDKETDSMLVTFMKGDQKIRQAMLENDGTRDTLFAAIRISTELYPKIFADRYKNLPKKTRDMKRRKNIEKPTRYDQAAQLQALIVLGNQAKVIVSHYDRLPANAGKNLTTELKTTDIPKDHKLVRTGLKFKAHGTKRARFQSALQRGGFNTRDLGLLALEGFMALGVVSGLAKNITNAKGDDFIDKIFNGLENTVTDPILIASTGLVIGTHMARRHPALLKYPWLNEYQRDGLTTAISLDFIDAKVTPSIRKNFTGSTAEWQILQRTPATKIQKLVKMANEEVKSGKRPRIGVKMMIKAGVLNETTDMDIIHRMAHGAGSNRTRYLIYSKFFNRKNKPDVKHIKELITGKRYIRKIE